MTYDKELFESRWLDLYWLSTAKFWDRDSWSCHTWPCGCLWIVVWKLRINILYRNHDITLEDE
jgi:hypothetical protein